MKSQKGKKEKKKRRLAENGWDVFKDRITIGTVKKTEWSWLERLNKDAYFGASASIFVCVCINVRKNKIRAFISNF